MNKDKETFIKKVKKIYPKEFSLHKAIKCGDSLAGRILYDMGSGNSISPSMIIVKCNLGEIDELRDKAQLIVDKSKLYTTWCELHDNW